MTTISSMSRGFDVKRLLPPDAALERFFASVSLSSPALENVALEDARARVLARSVDADDDYPAAPRSTMDGYAVRAASTPARLRIAGEIRIGERSHHVLAADEAMAIPTGGVLPEGADAIVPIERVSVDGDGVRVEDAATAGACVVERGADMRAGELLLEAGRRIGSAEAAVLASVGIAEVPVYRRPLVGVLSTGNEIVEPKRKPRIGEVRDANRYAIAASLEALGARVRHFPNVPDVEGALEAELRAALSECVGVVVSGGSSVGARDFMPAAVAALGAPGIVVHGLRVRPGKPTLLGAVGGKPVIGLPGNPLSALMMLEAVVAPIFAALVGASVPYDDVRTHLLEPIAVPDGWTWFVPLAISGEGARPLPMHSFAVSLAARASGYVRAEGEFCAGEEVLARRFLCGGVR